MAFVKVAEVSEMVPGRGKTIIAGRREYALFLRDGEYFCIDNECPHQYGPLAEGDLNGEEVVCPYHAWQFSLRTGEASYPQGFCVATHPVKVEDGAIWINIEN